MNNDVIEDFNINEASGYNSIDDNEIRLSECVKTENSTGRTTTDVGMISQIMKRNSKPFKTFYPEYGVNEVYVLPANKSNSEVIISFHYHDIMGNKIVCGGDGCPLCRVYFSIDFPLIVKEKIQQLYGHVMFVLHKDKVKLYEFGKNMKSRIEELIGENGDITIASSGLILAVNKDKSTYKGYDKSFIKSGVARRDIHNLPELKDIYAPMQIHELQAICDAIIDVYNESSSSLFLSNSSKQRLQFFNYYIGRTKYDMEIRTDAGRFQLFSRSIKELEFCTQINTNNNTYFGVNTRAGKGGGGDNVMELMAVYVDVDCKTENSTEEDILERKADALKRINEFPLKPSMLIDTGNGYHAYWFFEEVIELPEFTGDKVADKQRSETIAKFKGILKGMVKALNGDSAAADVARILRVPGTFNCKDIIKPCRLLEFNPDVIYSLSDFEPWEVAVEVPVGKEYTIDETTIETNMGVGEFVDILKENFACARIILDGDVTVENNRIKYTGSELRYPIVFQILTNISKMRIEDSLKDEFRQFTAELYYRGGLTDEAIEKADDYHYNCDSLNDALDEFYGETCCQECNFKTLAGNVNSLLGKMFYKNNCNKQIIYNSVSHTAPDNNTPSDISSVRIPPVEYRRGNIVWFWNERTGEFWRTVKCMREDSEENNGKKEKDNHTILSYFIAEIIEDINIQGMDMPNIYRIVGWNINGELPVIDVPANEYSDMKWVSKWGSDAIIASTKTAKDGLREAILLISTKIMKIYGYYNLGWFDDKFLIPTINYDGYRCVSTELTESYTLRGTLEKHIEIFRYYMLTRGSIVILSGMLSIILKKLNIPNFSLLIHGLSTTGKGLIEHVTLGLYGNPALTLRAWNKTSVGSELFAVQNNGIPIVFDDIEQAGAEQYEKVINYLYEFSTGIGRVKSNKNSILKPTNHYNGVMITSAEQNLETLVDSTVSKRVKTRGVYRRCIEIKSDVTFLQPIGESYISEEEYMNFIKNGYGAVLETFGHVGKEWITFSLANINALIGSYNDIKGRISNKSGMGMIFVGFFTILKSEFMRHYFTEDELKVIGKNILSIMNEHDDKMTKVKDIAQEFKDRLPAFVFSNHKNFMGVGYTLGDFEYSKKNKIYGYLEVNAENTYDLFIIDINALCKEMGFEKTQLLDALYKSGNIELHSNGNKKTYQNKKIIDNKRLSGYLLKNIMEPDTCNNNDSTHNASERGGSLFSHENNIHQPSCYN